MKKTGIFLIVGIVLCLGTSHSEATVVFDDGGVHEINWTISDNVDIYASSTGEPTIVNVVSGGRIDRFVFIYGNCELLVSGGTIGRYVFARGNNRIAISGGTIGRYIYAKNDSQIDISGGTVGGYINAKNSQIDISGGTIWGYVFAGSDSHLSITGGRIDGYVACTHSSQGTISGGTFGRNLQVWYDAVMYIYGTNFNFDYGEITGGSSNILTGTLASGEEINNEFSIWDGASIILVPAPGSLVGLEIVGPNEVPENFSASYKAIAHYKDDSTRDVTDSVLWVVEPDTYASIDDYGVLTTKDIVQGQLVTIRASYTEGGVTVEGQKAIHILALMGLEITGPNEVAGNFSASYKAIAYYDDESTRDVTDSALWVVEPNMAANIDDYGVLTTQDIVKHQSAMILASYTEGDVTFEAEKAIDILAICPSGSALDFDGINDYVYLGDIDEFEFGEDDFSISVWIYPRNHSGSGGHIITKYYWGNEQRQWWLAHSASDAILFYTNPTGASSDGERLASVSPVAQNAWAFITAVRKGSTKYIYINGELDTTGTTAGILTGQSAKVYIGVVDSPSEGLHNFFNGKIDDLRIHNRALDANDIQELMHKKLTGDEPNLVGYWDFDEGEGQIVYDLSGNGNDGQLGSTPEADVSDPAWVESDAPVGICTPYQIATMAVDRAVERKLAMLEELLAALAEEWTAYEALEELLESEDYEDLNKGDIVKAKQKIHSATQHEEQSIGTLDKSVEKLEDALSALGYEPDMAANIDGRGVLTTKDIVTHQSAIILASYTEGDVTFEAEKAINIFPICPTGTALQFDGVDDYVEVSYHPVLNTNKITVLSWVKGSAQIFGRVVSHYEHGVEQRAWTMYSAGEGVSDKLKVVVSDNGQYSEPGHRKTYRTTTTAFDNTWHFVGFTFDGPNSNLKLYVDGTEDTNVTKIYDDPISEIYNSTAGLTIGCDLYYGAADYLFKGLIDEVAIYNRALSAEEIQANMHRRLAGDEPGLIGYWDFDEGEGQIVYDLSGNGNDGQLGSTPSPDVSDPAWIESDAPIGICTPYQIATLATERAVECKTALLEELLAALAEEWTAYEALEELLESGDYGDLDKGDIVTAKQKIHSATQHGEQAIGALEKSIEKLEDALSALGYEPEPPPPPLPPGQASNPNPANGATNVSISADLSWTASSNAVSHDVYFGTTSPGAFRGNQTATAFAPGSMAENTTYYWRIDEVNPGGTTTGTIWSFTTGGGGWPPT